jgi:hypothetical protein
MPLVSGGYPPKSDIAAQAGGVSVLARYNMNRIDAVSDTAALTTQVMTSVAVNLQAGDLASKIAFRSGATAAGTPTNYWFALYSPAGVLLAQTADQLTTAWAADTVMDLALATAQLISVSGLHFAAIMVKATTPPTLVGSTLGRAGVSTGLLSTDKVLSQTSGAALTTTAPGTIATPTAIAAVPLVCVH